jgi:hypothetical protein
MPPLPPVTTAIFPSSSNKERSCLKDDRCILPWRAGRIPVRGKDRVHLRHLPVRPNLDQLKHQAKDLLRAARRGDAAASAELTKHHPERIDPAQARLGDAQLALARSYGLPSWPRLVLACRMTAAIRASLRKRLRFVEDETMHDYRDVTPLAWGERFHDQAFVNRPAMQLIAERGGHV